MSLEVIFVILALLTVGCNIFLITIIWYINNRQPLLTLAKGTIEKKSQQKDIHSSGETFYVPQNQEIEDEQE